MKKIKKTYVVLFVAMLVFIAQVSALAADQVEGGVWSYGAVHDPFGWGAFSNYFHPDRSHKSWVVRHSDSESVYGYADAQETSKAFINTKLGEVVDFHYGFTD